MRISLMSKLLMSVTVATLCLNAKVDSQTLLKYVKSAVVKNPQVKVNGVTIVESTTHQDLKGWEVLFTTLDLEYQKKEIHAPEMMFVKDGLITGTLTNLKTGVEYREILKPTVPQSYYNDAHLLFGNKDAKHKILVFSDPQCPFCQKSVPEIFKAAKENPSKIALYYYHLPLLRIHPVSGILTRIMHIAQEEGRTDVVEKMYTLKINPRETDMTKVLAKVHSHANYSISAEKINDAKVVKALKDDEIASGRLMVRGTPTIYIDGEWDRTRKKYKELIK